MDTSNINEELSETEADITSGNDIIDATQSAIVDAAENVSEALSSNPVTETITNVEKIPFYLDVEFWVAIAFILVVIVLAKPIFSYIKSSLQNRVKNVISQIEEAIKLRDDTQKLLADYERKFINTDKEVKQIFENSQKNIENYKKNELKKLDADLLKRENDVKKRINLAVQNAKNEINDSASILSVNIAKKAINNFIQNSDKSSLIDDAIADLDKIIK